MPTYTAAQLRAKYGRPSRTYFREDGNVFVSVHAIREAAEAFAHGNREHYGHPAWVEQDGEQWLSVCDLRPAIAELEEQHRAEHEY